MNAGGGDSRVRLAPLIAVAPLAVVALLTNVHLHGLIAPCDPLSADTP